MGKKVVALLDGVWKDNRLWTGDISISTRQN